MPSTPVVEFMREDSPGPTAMPDNTKQKSLKSARSVENLRQPPVDDRRGITIRKASTDSSSSLPNIAVASNNSSKHNRDRSGSKGTQDRPAPHPIRSDSMGIFETTSPRTLRPGSEPDTLDAPPRAVPSPSGRRSAPPVPLPVKRRKPPAVPAHRSPKLNGANGGGRNMATIGPSITSSPLSRDF